MLELPYDVSAAEVDAVYKHVHHARSIAILEWGRLQLAIKLGFPNEVFFARGLFPVVVAVHARYKREVLQERVTVTCDTCIYHAKKFVMAQRILNKRGKVAIEAEVEWCFMDGAEKKAVAAPDDFIAAFTNYFASSKAP